MKNTIQNKTIVMNVDYFDEVCIREKPFDADDVEVLIRSCAEFGVDTIFWRAIGLGEAGYPSRYLGEPGTLAECDMSSFLSRVEGEPADNKNESGNFVLQNQKRDSLIAWEKRISQSLQLMDPITAARDACKRHGLEFFIWHDYIDEQLNHALAKHPQWRVLGKDGITTFPGLRSYAIEEAVVDQLRVIEELLQYRPDGIYLCTSCHNRHLHFPEPDDFFGYEEPIKVACKERGVYLEADTFDQEIWHDVKGDSITNFFRRVKQLAKPLGVKLAIGTQLGQHTILTSPVFSTHVPYRFTTQWRQWIDEEIADILILGDYEWPWDYVPIWEAKRMHWPKDTYPADVEWREYAEYSPDRVRLYWFSSWLSAYVSQHAGASAGSLAEAMQRRAQTLAATPVQGICLHEAMTFERETDGFKTISMMKDFLQSAANVSSLTH